MASINYSHCIPFLPVKDLSETIQFYREILGFSNEWFFGGKPYDAGISRDGLNMLFVENPIFAEKINCDEHRLEICFFVSNVDEIFQDIKKKGIPFISELQNEPSNIREFSILDCNGYHLRIGEGLETEPLETHSFMH